MVRSFTLLLILILTIPVAYTFTTIEGYVYNLDRNGIVKVPTEVGIGFFDLTTGKEHYYQAQIEDNGTFNISFHKDFPQDVSLIFGKRKHPVFVQPDSSTIIGINAEAYLAKSYTSALDFMGSQSKMNYTIQAYLAEFEKLPHHVDHRKKKRELDPSSYQKYRADLYQTEKAFLKYFCDQHDVPYIFFNWAQQGILYSYGMDLFRYAWLHPVLNQVNISEMREKTISVSDSYFNFHTLFPANIDSSYLHSNYGRYLKEYQQYLLNKDNHNETSAEFSDQIQLIVHYSQGLTAEERNRLLVIGNTHPNSVIDSDRRFVLNIIQRDSIIREILARKACESELTSILQLNPSLMKERFLSWYMYDLIENLDWESASGMMPIFNQKVHSSRLKVYIINKFEELKNLIHSPSISPHSSLKKIVSQSEKNILNEIFSQNRGSLLYLVFWSPWSEPCRSQINDLKELVEEILLSNFRIVNVCLGGEEKYWKAIIAKYDWGGIHYFLNKRQSQQIIHHFNLKVVPYYKLVNAEGKLLKKNPPPPSEREKISQFVRKVSLNAAMK